jgi:leucyl-tRNA synthetase
LFPETVAAPEPFQTLLSQGMVHGKTYSEPSTGRFLHPSEVDLTNPEAPLIKGTQTMPKVSFEKMSKSKHNGVDPTACVARYGADATRAHVLFSAPVSEVLEWDETKIVGMERWFGRLWKLVLDAQQRLSRESYTISEADLQSPTGLAASLPPVEDLGDADADGLLATNEAIQSITNCIENNPYGLNTVISSLIKLTNALSSSPPPSSQILYVCLSSLLRLLAPVAPGLSSECWEILNAEMTPVLSSPWPTPLLAAQQVDRLSARAGQTVAVQVNGKLRFTATVPVSGQTGPAAEEWIVGRILETDQGRAWLREKNNWEARRRVIVVKGGKLVNVVF